MLERLLAGIVIIGALLWGASLVATPGDDAHESTMEPPEVDEPAGEPMPDLDEPAPEEPPAEEGTPAPSTRDGKGKRGPG